MGTMINIKGSMKVHAQVWHAQKGHSSEVKPPHVFPSQHRWRMREKEQTSQMLAIRAKRTKGVGPGNPTWKQIGGVTEVEVRSVLLEPAEASITP